MPRFVVLRHELPAGTGRDSHWDLMLEDGDSLATWALDSLPNRAAEIAATRLDDHRKDYLDYEGPVSAGRGRVLRWDAGTYTTMSRGERQWSIEIAGQRLRGTLTLCVVEPASPAAPHQWCVKLLSRVP